MTTPPPTVGPAFVGDRSPDVHAVDVDDEAVLLHEPTGQLHLLNPTGALVWHCLDGRATLQAIAEDIADVGGLDGEQVLAQLQALLTDLVDGGLVMAADPAGPTGT
ncbi:MAG TPA: HPr-rel-A system PqqD family peptide chaperone [Euzebya sp.]|nr:HPr-rel-A system PqqD family peptide chaperone [Euzebya sp.]